MYTKRNIVYAEPYKILQGSGVRAYQAKGSESDFTEADCPIDDLTVRGEMARWGNGAVTMLIGRNPTYEAIKTKLVKIRYSNDDQIAVMLNKDPVDEARMEAWRSWASDVARAICKRMGLLY